MWAECEIESVETVKDTSSIIRMKKDCNVVSSFAKLGIDVGGYNFINTKLLLTYYHHIHCPVNAELHDVITIDRNNEIFGDNMVWVLKLDSMHSTMYLLLVGESEIQDFDFKVKIGDTLGIFDEIGNFTWGSQTLLFYKNDELDERLILSSGRHCFVGDTILI